MGKSLNTFAKPSLDEFCDYIDKHGFDLDPFALYKEFDKRDGLMLRVKLLSLGRH